MATVKIPFWRSILRAMPGSALVGLVTFLCFGLALNPTSTAFLYLIVVVLQSLLGDFLSSAIVSIIAVLCLNFFFIPPIFSFRVSDSADIWSLISFLLTALVVTRLTTQIRHEADISEQQRHEMKMLYKLSQGLLTLDPREEMLKESVLLFRGIVGLRAVCLYDGKNAVLLSDGASQAGLAERTRAAYLCGQDSDDAVAGVFCRPLRAVGETMGAVGFEGLLDADLTVDPLTALAALILERARTFREASQAEAEAQAEVFRGAILDALAHEFKTPLACIVTAAGGLREAGSLLPAQLELAEMVETEASRLGILTSRLLRVARLDKEDVEPQQDVIDIVSLISDLTNQYSRRWTDRQLSVTKADAAVEVLADAELIRLAVLQLLDNACNYSQPASSIVVSIEVLHEFVTVRVWNGGSSIPSADRARIFERFYRGTETRRLAPGSGLGLYVARKIVQAHGGSLDLEPEAPGSAGTAFRLTLPIAKNA
jgi:two-component system sensor histidine kinase KdpD